MKRKHAKRLAMGAFVVAVLVPVFVIHSMIGKHRENISEKDFAQFCQTQAYGSTNTFDSCKRELFLKYQECVSQKKEFAQPCLTIVTDAYKEEYGPKQ